MSDTPKKTPRAPRKQSKKLDVESSPVIIEKPDETLEKSVKTESELIAMARAKGSRFEFNYVQGRSKGFDHDKAWKWASDREIKR